MGRTTAGQSDSNDRRTLAVRGVVAVALSLVANWVVLSAVLVGDLARPFDPLAYPPVTLFTAFGSIGAVAVYGALTRLSESPDRTFTIVAAVVLLLSFLPDLGLLRADPNATVAGVVALMVMHATVAAICVAVLTGRVP